jgi:hypothetical protein
MSLIGIYNTALVPLGVDRILDPDEETEQARKCNEVFPYIRDDELSGHPWNFATTKVQCALTTETVLYGYTYAYQKPSDCLRVIEIYTDEDAYQVVGNYIYTDVSPLQIEYIRQVTDTNEYSSAFKTLLSARLKYELCYALTGSRTMVESLYEVLKQERKRAKSIDAQEGTPKNIFSNRVIDARSGVVR